MKLKPFFLLAAVAAIVSSCQKEAPSRNCSVSMQNLAGTYKLAAMHYKMTPASPEQNYLALMDDCEKDDLVKLNSNGTYQYTDAGLVCSPSGSTSGTWSLSGNTLQSDGFMAGTISKFNCDTLVFVTDDVFVDGDKLTFTMAR